MNVLNRLSFQPGFQIKILPPDRVLLFDDRGYSHLLEGRLYALLAPYLREKYTVDQILKKLSQKASQVDIYHALLRLEKKGIIGEEVKTLPKSLLTFCHRLSVPPEEAVARLKRTSLSFFSLGKGSTQKLKKALREFPFASSPPSSLNIVAADHYCRKELRKFHRQALQTKTPWLLIKPVGIEVWVGPLFIPHQTACFECLLHALQRNQVKNAPPSSKASLDAVSSIGYNLAALEIFKWAVRGSNPELEGKIFSYDSASNRAEHHLVIRRPQCLACQLQNGGIDRSIKPFELVSQKKYFFDGGYRTIAPEETWKNYSHLVSPITGMVQSVVPSSNGCSYTFKALRNRKNLKAPKYLAAGKFLAVSGGKGKTESQAKVGALCETLERLSTAFRGDEVKKRGCYRALKGDAIHPYSCLLFSEVQYQTRKTWNQTCHLFHTIPSPFDETTEIEWSPLWSLTEKCWKWLPTAYCYFGYPFRSDRERFCTGDSNGCAAGNTKEEAVLQGFFELVERDFIALWWYSRLQRPQVDLESFQEPWIEHFLSQYKALGREVWVLDLTFDLPLPTMVAISRKIGSEKEAILFGFGTHLDAKIALSRALTEMSQSVGGTEEEEVYSKKRQGGPEWLRKAHCEENPHLLPMSPFKKYSDYPIYQTEDLAEDIRYCQRLLQNKGLEMLILDLTRPEISLPVVRVVVPGLRHFWNRFAPGRLYDVPVQLGFIPKKLKEEELNPVSIFL